MCESLASELHPLGSVHHREEAVWAELSLWGEYALSGIAAVCPVAPLASLPLPLTLES